MPFVARWRDAFGTAGRPYRRALGAAAAAGSAAGIYLRLIQHRRQQRSMPPSGHRMPGDAVLSGPVSQHTRSILISASAPEIWSFVNLLSHGRTGWYLLDRLSAPDSSAPDSKAAGSSAPGAESPGADSPRSDSPGADSPRSDSPGADSPGSDSAGSADAPDFTVPDSRSQGVPAPRRFFTLLPAADTGDGIGDDIADLLQPGTGHRLRIKEVQPNEWMLWTDGDGRSTWLWLLQPVRSGQTRLLVRGRFRYRLRPGGLAALPLDAVDWATMRRCLTSIRDRAVLWSATRPGGA
ncbi:hypothetical protein H9639_03220 [Arthrobacter sp. Sa2CUA1]|uniref:SRPBCC family protein n=1 Tax=Arthrobacter gallicola TaxID=2762225 RepID=A0ABR8UPL5_9MICC|nr:hypothetical protein [Arthrobacter gallicola]MBD7994307.1 hypothetical protein [Arthrobacter gallicola]